MGNNRIKVIFACDDIYQYDSLISILNNKYNIIYSANNSMSVKENINSNEDVELIIIAEDNMDTVNDLCCDGLSVLPIIAVIEPENIANASECIRLGAVDYIMKDFASNIIYKRIHNTVALFTKHGRMIELMRAQADIRKKKSNQLEHIDEVTGALNYTGFKERALHIINSKPDTKYALWYCDIRNFKFFNDSFGYVMGDKLLRNWVQFILNHLKSGETLGRVSADRIAILSSYTEEYELIEKFNMTCDFFDAFMNSVNNNYKIEHVCGIYKLLPEDMNCTDITYMLDMANNVCKRLKKEPKSNFGFYSREIWERQKKEVEISNGLSNSIKNGEISLWLQPQIDYAQRRIIGAEALCRWNHNTYGWLFPDEFIPLLERTGQIIELDTFMWEEVCRHIRKWIDSGRMVFLPISINISRIDLLKGDVLCILNNLLEKYELEHDVLKIEITESAYSDNSEFIINEVQKLHDSGFVVEMDDFGSGYSSLNMLRSVPIDVLKMDMRFQQEAETDIRAQSIIKAVVGMSNDLDIPVISEGVESLEQAEFLYSVGCSMMQGYYFAKPMDVSGFEKIIEKQLRHNLNSI